MAMDTIWGCKEKLNCTDKKYIISIDLNMYICHHNIKKEKNLIP